MPRQQTEDDKKHGDKLEPLVERAGGKEGADDEPEEVEDDEDLDDDEDADESDDEDDAQ
jgi:hypothetical protein